MATTSHVCLIGLLLISLVFDLCSSVPLAHVNNDVTDTANDLHGREKRAMFSGIGPFDLMGKRSGGGNKRAVFSGISAFDLMGKRGYDDKNSGVTQVVLTGQDAMELFPHDTDVCLLAVGYVDQLASGKGSPP